MVLNAIMNLRLKVYRQQSNKMILLNFSFHSLTPIGEKELLLYATYFFYQQKGT